MNVSPGLRIVALIGLLSCLSGCTFRALVMEARCGLGKDYVCGPVRPGGPWACGCIPVGKDACDPA